MNKKVNVKSLEIEAKKISPKKPNHLAIVKQKVINLHTSVELVRHDYDLAKEVMQENKNEIVRAIEWLKNHGDRLQVIEEKLEDIVDRLEVIENDRFWDDVDK